MTQVTYLDFESVVDLNERHCADSFGVRDENVVRGALGRAEATFMGADLAVTIWDKAAVLLHGLATTQGFHNGNKRTAWLTTTVFLGVNGAPLRDLDTIHAEVFVRAVAKGVIDDIAEIARWLKAARMTAADRLQSWFIADAWESREDGGPATVKGFGIRGFSGPGNGLFPCILISTWRFHPWDLGRTFTFSVGVSPRNGQEPPYRLIGPTDIEVAALHYQEPEYEGEPSVAMVRIQVVLEVHGHGDAHLTLSCDGEVAALTPLRAEPKFEMGSSFFR